MIIKIWKRYGRTLEERFWEKVDKHGTRGCWEWIGARSKRYGKFDDKLAHRVSYELSVGPIPENMTIDHLCRNIFCVNPEHLEVVTQKENVLRGYSPSANHARQRLCLRGHRFDVIRYNKGKPVRRCRKCERINSKAYNDRKKLSKYALALRLSNGQEKTRVGSWH
jgi:hypothetical protein